MTERKSKWFEVGSVMSKKDGKGVYVKISNDVILKKGGFLTVQDPRTRPGITQEQLEKIPDFVKYKLFLVQDAS